jgi:hypothetical protein
MAARRAGEHASNVNFDLLAEYNPLPETGKSRPNKRRRRLTDEAEIQDQTSNRPGPPRP